mgnify:FL=1
MLIEVRVKVTRIIDAKKRKKLETYILNKSFFSEAEYKVTEILNTQHDERTVDSFEIQSLKLSTIKEIADQYEGQYSFLATLKDIYHDDNGNEKSMRYKVLLWANDLTSATHNARELQRQGYDMQIEGLKEVDYTYI